VNTISLEDMDQIYAIKVLLEGFAGRLSTPTICRDTSKLEALRKLREELEHCFEKRDVEGYFLLNDKFHSYLWQFCGNKWLAKILEQLTSQVNRFIVKSLYVPNRMRKSVQEHREIFAKIERGDPIGVEKAIGTHFKNASDDLRRELVSGV
jgi:DNA-binding GntR family transcriptional regulator